MGRNTGYWWSPDDAHIAFTRVDESPVAEIERFEIYADSVKVVKQRYPAAGARNALVKLFVRESSAQARRSPKPMTEMDLGSNPDIYLARVELVSGQQGARRAAAEPGSEDAHAAAADAAHGRGERAHHRAQRHLGGAQRRADVAQELAAVHLGVEPHPGTTTCICTTTTASSCGRSRRATGKWSVKAATARFAAWMSAAGCVYFMANTETPIERQLYSVSLREPGAQPKRVTQGVGLAHRHDVAAMRSVFLDTFSTPDQPPSLTLRSATGAVARGARRERAEGGPSVRAVSWPSTCPTEFGTLKASDGQTLHYQLVKPQASRAGQALSR